MKKTKRIMVDMSATIIHHGHIRLLHNASKHGKVIVGLTSDEEIKTKKGYTPELEFTHRKEILEAITYVDEVVETPWLLTDKILEEHSIDLLIHGDDNSNHIKKENLLVFPRTEGISSTEIRGKSTKIFLDKRNDIFDVWNEKKKQTHKTKMIVGFKQREIFWVKIGQNIGSEEYGKGDDFQRPVLIVKKLNANLFIGIPLTSQAKEENDYFHPMTFNSKKGTVNNYAMILQLKTFDKKRLMGRIGRVDKETFNEIMKKSRDLFIPA